MAMTSRPDDVHAAPWREQATHEASTERHDRESLIRETAAQEAAKWRELLERLK